MTGKYRIQFNKIIKRIVPVFLCLIFALAAMQTAYAAGTSGGEQTVNPIGQSDSYSAVLYDNTSGLPTSESNDIAQTSEGFIWIGCYSGLIRYDGNTFERIDSTTGVGSAVSLHVDRQDRLWIGTNDSGLALMERGEFRRWGTEDGLGSGKVTDIAEGADGTIYAATTAGISMILPDMSLVPVDDPKIASAYVEWMGMEADGLIHCLTNEDDYFTLRDGKLVDYVDHTRTSVPEVTSILVDPDSPDKMFIGTSTGLYYGDPRTGGEVEEYADISPLNSVMDIQKIGDRIWVCARNGIGVLDGRDFYYLDDLPADNSVAHVMEDYEGNLWFTSARQGVMKVVRNRFSDVFARYGVETRVVNTTCMYNGDLYVGTDTGLVVIGGNGVFSGIPLKEVKTATGEDQGAADLLEILDRCRIRSIVKDSKGRLWISTWRSLGLLRYDPAKKALMIFTKKDGLLSDHIRAVCETSDGSFLVACTGGLNVIEGDRVTAGYGKNEGISNPESLTVATASNGDFVLGSNGGGIYVINGQGTRCIGTKDGLSSGIVMRIKRDPARDIFWIVTSNSIAYMTSDYQVHTVKEFPFSNNFDMYENSRGEMWVLSGNGIYIVPTEELIANGKIIPVHYGMANGMLCNATSNSYSELTQEGDLYIAGSSGVVKVNIDAEPENIGDLKQAVPFIDIDGKRIYPDETGGFTIPSDVRRLTVYSYVFNYSLTDPLVSYCLEGFDPEPVTVSRSDLGPVTYTNLHGGSYKFVMELKDAMGQESKTLSVPIVKIKALYEQVWFYVLLGLAAAVLIGVLIRAYIRRRVSALEAKHREEVEKERISSELKMANEIQGSMLPHIFPPFPERNEFDLYASTDPAKEVGGDFYDFYMIDDDHLCLEIADVSGKGIPAALFMMISKVILQSFSGVAKSSGEILTRTNEALCANNQVEMFVTVWLGILEVSTGRLVAANAGHEYPVIMHSGGQFELFKDKHDVVVGAMEGVKYREYELQLQPGDKLFLYTDGVPEATGADQQMFGTERMIAALNTDTDASPKELLGIVRKAVDDFTRGAEQFDDLTMLCLEFKG